jgi:hypothetical protein
VKILAREEVLNEVIEVGGPSTMSMNDVTTLVEQKLGRGGRRRHIPVFAMNLLPPVVRLFDELVARMMSFGALATTERPLPGWQKAADRFGVRPRTVDDYVARLT